MPVVATVVAPLAANLDVRRPAARITASVLMVNIIKRRDLITHIFLFMSVR